MIDRMRTAWGLGAKATRRRNSVTLARAAIIALMLAAVTAVMAEVSQAQTEQTLVSNTGQAAGTSAPVGTDGTDTFVQAQAFTTGTDPHGFTLTKVTVNIGGYASGDAFTAAIHSNSTAGQPGSSLYSLTNPSSIADGSIDLTAPAGAHLEPRTTYHLVIRATTGAITVATTGTNDEDDANQGHWSIADTRNASTDGGSSWTSNDTEIKVAVLGSIPDENVLVSNLQQAQGNAPNVGGASRVRLAQPFTTGPGAASQMVAGVTISLLEWASGDVMEVGIYSNGSNNRPDMEIVSLTPPSTIQNGDLTLTAPGDTLLSPKHSVSPGLHRVAYRYSDWVQGMGNEQPRGRPHQPTGLVNRRLPLRPIQQRGLEPGGQPTTGAVQAERTSHRK